MFKCNTCQYSAESPFGICPSCGSASEFTEQQIRDYLYIIHKAQKSKRYEVAVSGYRALADIGHTPSEIEYAKILEKGELVPKDIDSAMKYFYRAAAKNDAYGAYRYSRLLAKTSDSGARFWLMYSVLLGCPEAYSAAAELYSGEGDDMTANYYYALAAESDDMGAAVTLAKRYYNGIGTDPNNAYAKWYLDKLRFPPFGMIRIAYKLRAVQSEDPKISKPPKAEGLITELAVKAKSYRYFSAYFNLVSMMSKNDAESLATLGTLYAEGVGCEVNAELALKCLRNAAARGVRSAHIYLAGMHLDGRLMAVNTDAAIEHYEAAARLGDITGYELIGDLYYDGHHVRCDLARAIECYDTAAKMGNGAARVKAEGLKDEREALFAKAEDVIDTDPELAFKYYAISSGMGYVPAYSRLAKCYLVGIGTNRDRQRAHMWYEYAVRKGDDSALYDLGLCYSHGIGTAFDFKKAIELLTMADNRGDARAETEMLRLLENKKRSMAKSLFSTAMRLLYQKKFHLSKQMLDVCAMADNPKAIYTLGCFYEFGIGTKTDRELAFTLYERAYVMRFRDPRQTYKLKVLKMTR